MESMKLLIFIQLSIFHAVFTQCVNRVVQGPNGPIELLPNQVLLPPGQPFFGPLPPGQPVPPGRSFFIPGPTPPCKPQPIAVPTQAPIPAEYMTNYGPVIANIPPNVIPGNIVPNVEYVTTGTPNIVVPNMEYVSAGNVIVPNVMSNVVVPNMAPAIPNVPFVPNVLTGNMVVPNAAPVVPTEMPTLIHDNSVANSLANALQLLVVSNLLSNTLPGPYEPPCYDGYMPGYSYIY